MRPNAWDKYEVALLIDMYQRIKAGAISREAGLAELSNNLRQMAINRGVQIDDVYRNLSGMSWQMAIIDKMFTERYSYGRKPAAVFTEMVALYNDEREQYNVILQETKEMIQPQNDTETNRKDFFVEWLNKTNVRIPVSNIVECYEFSFDYAQRHGMSRVSIWEISDVKVYNSIRAKLSASRIFKFSHKSAFTLFEKTSKYYSDFLKETVREEDRKGFEKADVKRQERKEEQLTTNSTVERAVKADNHVEESKRIDETSATNVQTIESADIQSLPSETHVSLADTSLEVKLDFADKQEEYVYTNVVKIITPDGTYAGPLSWRECYSLIVKNLQNRHHELKFILREDDVISGVKINYSETEASLRSPLKMDDGFYLEGNHSAKAIVNRLGVLIKLCGEPYSAYEIYYLQKTATARSDSDVSGSERDSFIPRRIPDNNTIIQFREWLGNGQGMAMATVRGYASAVKTINEWAMVNGIFADSIFDLSATDARKAIAILVANNQFTKFNTERHNQFSAALTKYLGFLGVAHVEVQADNEIDEELKSSVNCILKDKYPYGYKIDSIREAMRFRRFAEEREVELPETDDELKAIIIATGDVIEDKVYARNNDLQEELNSAVDELFQTGINVIYYESFMNNQVELMDKYHITSEDILKEYLQKSITGVSFAKRFMCVGERYTETEAVGAEMMRVWGEEAICSYESLKDRLPYIPESNIQRILFSNSKFVWVSEGIYHSLDRFIITDEDREQILNYVETKCIESGFASLPDVPISHLEVENYSLTPIAIQTAIYRTVLNEQYKLNGKILTKESSTDLDIVTIIKREYAGWDNCSFEEVANRVEEILGVTNRQSAFKALYDDYVRADVDRFVANHYVEFLVDEIDRVLSTIYIHKFGAVKQVSTFAMFPICGIPWNHYVLESFCYKYSKKYSLHVINYNNKNAGIIAEKTFNKSYDEMLAITMANSNVELKKDLIIPYLCENGFLGKSRYGKIDELIKKAQELREG